MKNLILPFLLLITTISIAQKPFAKIENLNFIIEKDTIEFKKFLKENLFSETQKPISLDKVEIKKQVMLTSKDEYYFVLITDFKNHIRIAKWLNKIGDNLYSKENIDSDDLFENLYQICIGEENCMQNVFTQDSKRYWTCGEVMKCLTDEQAKISKCKFASSLITAE